jgi:transcriptional regulator with XRE-family HTH domain
MRKDEIGQIIQKRRNFLSLKQEDLSEMTGITSKTIYLIENGKGNPSMDTLQKLLNVLGLEMIIDIKKISE